MLLVKAPTPLSESIPRPALFLAGGISQCPNWQESISKEFLQCDGTLINPRRDTFALNDSVAAKEQIAWEYHALRTSDAIMFWFPKESMCPIALYELGAWTLKEVPLFIGIHPDYPRKLDVVTQTSLERPHEHIYDSLDSMAHAIRQDLFNCG